jgi:hypothetical protein
MRGLNTHLPLGTIQTDAPYILYSGKDGVVSAHQNRMEARAAFFERAGHYRLGGLPCIYKRRPEYWEAD